LSAPYSEIIKTLENIEKELKLPGGILKRIYDKEKNVVFMGTRTNILVDLRRIIMSELESNES
jgi:hypothetical protein